jgi:hypothetical protein
MQKQRQKKDNAGFVSKQIGELRSPAGCRMFFPGAMAKRPAGFQPLFFPARCFWLLQSEIPVIIELIMVLMILETSPRI